MYNLRLLKIYNSEAGNNCKVYLPDGLKSLSDELRYLQWDAYPLKSLPSNFHPENLVELNLSHSKLRVLWKGDLVWFSHYTYNLPLLLNEFYNVQILISPCYQCYDGAESCEFNRGQP